MGTGTHQAFVYSIKEIAITRLEKEHPVASQLTYTDMFVASHTFLR
jgi:hypothetical protein